MAARFDGGVVIPQLSQASPEDATQEAYTFHTTTRPQVNGLIPSYMPPMGASSVSLESILLSRGGTRHSDVVASAEREGKLKIKATGKG